MPTDKYHVGRKVQLVDRYAPVGDYEIVWQLPKSNGEFQYRIKGSHEAHERVVKKVSCGSRSTREVH